MNIKFTFSLFAIVFCTHNAFLFGAADGIVIKKRKNKLDSDYFTTINEVRALLQSSSAFKDLVTPAPNAQTAVVTTPDTVEKPTSITELVTPIIPEQPSTHDDAPSEPSKPTATAIADSPKSKPLSRQQKRNRRNQDDLLPPTSTIIPHTDIADLEIKADMPPASSTSIPTTNRATQSPSPKLPTLTTTPPKDALAVPANNPSKTYIQQGTCQPLSVNATLPKKNVQDTPQSASSTQTPPAEEKPLQLQPPAASAPATPAASAATNSVSIKPKVLHPSLPTLPFSEKELLESIEKVIADPKLNINAANERGNTHLHIAAALGSLPVVEKLCNRSDININQANNEGQTPFDLAMRLLLNYAANPTNMEELANIDSICQYFKRKNAKRLIPLNITIEYSHPQTLAQATPQEPIQLHPHVTPAPTPKEAFRS